MEPFTREINYAKKERLLRKRRDKTNALAPSLEDSSQGVNYYQKPMGSIDSFSDVVHSNPTRAGIYGKNLMHEE